LTDAPPAPPAPPSPPSGLFLSRRDALRASAALGPVVDLACGRGRHALAAASLGLPTLALDRDAGALASLAQAARAGGLPFHPVRADLERGEEIPIRPSSCGAILVFRFLYRPLAPAIADALAPGGLLLYETFTTRHPSVSRSGPRNPAFLLGEGELPTLFPGLAVLCFEEGVFASADGAPQALARLAARKPAGGRGSDAQ
jgi:tellurite methyltransferase